jgi:hypothetical protein
VVPIQNVEKATYAVGIQPDRPRGRDVENCLRGAVGSAQRVVRSDLLKNGSISAIARDFRDELSRRL